MTSRSRPARSAATQRLTLADRLVATGVVSADDRDVLAVLLPVRGQPSPTFLARLGLTSARPPGLSRQAGDVLGGIARSSLGWAPVAYADRAFLLRRTGPVTFLDDVDDLPRAVAALIRHWRTAPHSHTTTYPRKDQRP
ncbi:hypothetical protein [Actinomadura atramentaria]|uniref:hypothetical protein n=1 Tax=Actinomadura atramentaria TaxID=1990 RepID=UPI00037F89D2|nr:hypothetical protein [Actinomadura atramentaria]